MSKRTPAEVESKVCEMYLADAPIKEIMATSGKCWVTVYNILRRNGIEPKGDSRLSYSPTPYVLPDIDPIWAAEFRGFFWADGCAGLDRRHYTNKTGHRYPIYFPKIRIELRDDNLPLLEHIQSVVGGNVYPKRSSGAEAPKAHWYIGGYAQCKTVIETLLLGGQLPAKKREDVRLLHEAVIARYSFQRRLTDAQRAVIHSYYLRLRSVKLYTGS